MSFEFGYQDHVHSLLQRTTQGAGDSDRHAATLFSIALACKGKTYLELGVRSGSSSLPILIAAAKNGGKLHSVDINATEFTCPPELEEFWEFKQSDAVEFLESWNPSSKIDFIYIDDWHSYEHVKAELEIIDRLVGPSSIILLHDLMWGNHDPFYHCDLTLKSGQWANGGPYRAVCELNSQFWEWATLPWNNGLTILRKKYSNKYHSR